MTTLRKRFGLTIRTLRKAKGLTQEMLGEKTGLHNTYIGAIERGERNPSLKCIEKIAKAFRVNIHELFSLPPIQRKTPAQREIIATEILSLMRNCDEHSLSLVRTILQDIIKWHKHQTRKGG